MTSPPADTRRTTNRLLRPPVASATVSPSGLPPTPTIPADRGRLGRLFTDVDFGFFPCTNRNILTVHYLARTYH